MMISPQAIAAKYGLKLLGALSVVGLLVYAHHSIDQGGYDRAKAKYEFRDAKATAEALGILSESKRKNDNVYERDKLDYENRIKELTNNLAAVAADTASVPIRTQGPQACGTTKTNDTERNGGEVGETGIAELAEYNRGLVIQTGAKINAMARELLECSRKVREAYDVR
jgi:hypothetical protein